MNQARGEIAIEIDGSEHIMCLTLGALAELEARFECQSLRDLQARLKRLTASELLDVLAILMITKPATDALARLAPAVAAKAVAEAFDAALG